jgi:ABC-type multidrug transport system ATPase subunit
VEQFGVHAEKSTVRESLEFSALLRLPPSTTPAQRSAVCDLLVKMLELGPIEHMLIGSADRGGLSFEENKRVTIAVELVSGPSVVFADEPTSGLTSREAMVTMRALSRVCMSGRAVICTIHQPSAAVFEIFQRLLMLRRGGQVTYFGPISGLQTYFEAVPGVRPLPAGQNPATWMLEIQGAGTSGAVQTIDFAEAYAFSGLARVRAGAWGSATHGGAPLHADGQENQTILDGLMPPPPESEEELSVDLHMLHNAEYTQSNATQLSSLLRRQSLTYWRSPTYSLLRWLIQLFFAIIAGTTFLLQPLNNAAAVQSRVGIINMMLILLGNYNGNVIIPFVFQRRALFYRERASNMCVGCGGARGTDGLGQPPLQVHGVVVHAVRAACRGPLCRVRGHALGGGVLLPRWCVACPHPAGKRDSPRARTHTGMVPAAAAFFYYAFLVFLYTEFATFNAMLWCGAMPGPGPATLLSTLVLQISVLFSGISVPGNQLASWLLGAWRAGGWADDDCARLLLPVPREVGVRGAHLDAVPAVQ